MATLVLQAAGGFLGGSAGGAFGAVLGRAFGAIAGNVIDQNLFSNEKAIEGPRLENSRILSSADGSPIPRCYGRNRLSGQIIWATRFEEESATTTHGGKGGGPKSKITEYSYYANFAVGICEGPITAVRRVWADGKELDLTRIDHRVYYGTPDQEPDPLIEAKQGTGNAPAYRGTAYVVFEGLLLEEWGNRIPQLNFEVIRSVGNLEKSVKSVCVIPGATEYGYHPLPVAATDENGQHVIHNRHTLVADTDWCASIDELQRVCPNLERVSLVVTWYGDDLRAGNCQIMPGVTDTIGPAWTVSGVNRSQAHVVSKVDGRAAFGGTPDDASVLAAIADLKARGLEVFLYPFVMMDVPADNALPSPYGEPSQSAYPWRGRITCDPASGQPNSADQTAAAASQVNGFVGNATVGDFSAGTDTVYFNGAAQWSYRRLILHYAHLCAAAGGVDGFLIGSELRGLTTIRNASGQFPFVDALVDLASDVKVVLGAGCKVTYGADWSEYFGYHPPDGSNDIYYHLDPLWAAASIDAIGIDNYMPLSDWRDAGDPHNADARSAADPHYLAANVTRGEGYDWYYASASDRQNAIRTPITDGAGQPWVWRYKDLLSWWQNPHHNRIAGEISAAPTAWQPQSKPVWFTELGCPAVDKGGNQPNLFPDAKSSESGLPHFSSGGFDHLVQRRVLDAHFGIWDPDSTGFDALNNPLSSSYGGRMVDPAYLSLWAWDARPYPEFPSATHVWSDGSNWRSGHWLNGRMGGCPVPELIAVILEDYGISDFECYGDGYVDGYLVPTVTSARHALEPLIAAHGISAHVETDRIIFEPQSYADRAMLESDVLAQEGEAPAVTVKRVSEQELPGEVVISHTEPFQDFQTIVSKSRRMEGVNDRQVSISLPAVIDPIYATGLGDQYLQAAWTGRENLTVSLPYSQIHYAPGDVISEPAGIPGLWQIEAIDTGLKRQLSLKSTAQLPKPAARSLQTVMPATEPEFFGPPAFALLDLPALRDNDGEGGKLYAAVNASPWARTYQIVSSAEADGYSFRALVENAATMGVLLENVTSGPLGVWDYASRIRIELANGSFASASDLATLNGANLIAIETSNGGWELLQFATAELEADGTWTLSRLLRAQFGTDPEMMEGCTTGGQAVLVNAALTPISLEGWETGIAQNWRVGPARDAPGSPNYAAASFAPPGNAQRMYRPVHIFHAIDDSGDVALQWIRRGRNNADNWVSADIPPDYRNEAYQVRVLDLSGTELRAETVSAPAFLYAANDRQTDLGAMNIAFDIAVAQLGDNGLAGAESLLRVTP